ncbi:MULTISPECIES: hypothetical protein [unclassified Motilimonas]|uniref:hypothetical protein n=1 Tax=Motilimonas TaxID=1914248 RepID=UPI001E5D97E5|nr:MULTISPECIES: hypothetical protein [unclassified Motilimonas]MCE0559295.1 hypothetical protein [Motilimonas sp. E26]MDO6524055.1 hypothetical protein [Motilimonas sp. 1_MG-2023]
MYKFLLLFFTMIGPALALPVPADIASQVSQRANMLASATLLEDYEQVIALSYPAMVNKIGGPSMAAKIAYEAVRLLNEEGVVISDLTIGEPLEYFVGKDKELIVLSTQLELKSEQGRVNTDSYLFAIREAGTDWMFIDSNALKDIKELKVYFPGLPEDFSLPQKAVKFTPITK